MAPANSVDDVTSFNTRRATRPQQSAHTADRFHHTFHTVINVVTVVVHIPSVTVARLIWHAIDVNVLVMFHAGAAVLLDQQLIVIYSN